MGGSTAQHMVKSDASNYPFYMHLLIPPSRTHLPLFRTLTPSMLPKSARPCSLEKPSIPKIYPAVATKPVTDDTPVCCHFIDACL